jgi:hypothetical protein
LFLWELASETVFARSAAAEGARFTEHVEEIGDTLADMGEGDLLSAAAGMFDENLGGSAEFTGPPAD